MLAPLRSTTRSQLVPISAALLLMSSGTLGAQVTVSGNPPLMHVTTAMAGSEPATVTTATTTYTVIVASGSTRRITGRLLTAAPVGTTVTVSLDAPPGATSMGAVVLDLTEKDLVVNIPRPTTATQTITYTFTTTVSAGVIPNSTRTVRFRLRV